MKTVRILVVDDYALIRQGVKMYLRVDPSVEVVGEAENGEAAVRMAKRLQPDVILMDLVMPVMSGIEAIIEIKRDLPQVKIIALSLFGEQYQVQAALNAGADGYLLKNLGGEALLRAIKAVLQGDIPLHPDVSRHMINQGIVLTDREREVLKLLSKGFGDEQVAKALNIRPGTAKFYISSLFKKLKVTNRTEAVTVAVKKGLISAND